MEMASQVVFGVVLPLLCCEDVLFTQVTCGMGCFVLPNLSFRGELILSWVSGEEVFSAVGVEAGFTCGTCVAGGL